MKSVMLGMLAETPIHPGAGRSLGVVDLPVAREAASGYPVVAGSSFKGSLRERAEQQADNVDEIFGKPDRAGDVLVSDARLLLLPVRSLAAAARWVTCRQLLERFRRDLARAGIEPLPQVPEVAPGTALVAGGGTAKDGSGGHLFLEERVFEVSGEPDGALVEAILPLVRHDAVHGRLREQLVLLSDGDFAWFSEFGLPVQARNKLADDGTKRSENLWYEETLPPDTVMYALLLAQQEQQLVAVGQLFDGDCYLQVGGNATVGQGWFAVAVCGGGAQ